MLFFPKDCGLCREIIANLHNTERHYPIMALDAMIKRMNFWRAREEMKELKYLSIKELFSVKYGAFSDVGSTSFDK